MEAASLPASRVERENSLLSREFPVVVLDLLVEVMPVRRGRSWLLKNFPTFLRTSENGHPSSKLSDPRDDFSRTPLRGASRSKGEARNLIQ